MSCYEWENGVFPLPSTEYPKFKKNFREAWNKRIEANFQKALQWWANNRKTKKPTYADENYEAVAPYFYLYRTRNSTPNGANFGVVGYSKERKTPRKPVRKDFPLTTNRDLVFHFDEATVAFDDKTKTVEWNVMENNHACSHAREHPMAQEFFRLLNRVKWTTKRKGGQIVGNDEYNQDNQDAGCGGNYVKQTFPQKVQPYRQQFMGSPVFGGRY